MTNQPWVPRFCADELVATTPLTCEQFGLLQRLRDWAWVNGGIPADEGFVEQLAKSYHVTRYKFQKIWKRIENFFTFRDGNLFYEEDEEKRRTQVVNIANARYFGKLGAEKRWRKASETAPEAPPENDSPPIAPPYLDAMANQNHSHIRRGEPPPPPTPSSESGGGGFPLSDASGFSHLAVDPEADRDYRTQSGHAPTPDAPPYSHPIAPLSRENPQALPSAVVPAFTDASFQAICQRSIDLGMAAPGRDLCVKIFQLFAGDLPALLRVLIRWEGQQQAGLWGTKCRADFELEATRQAVTRKPLSREDEKMDYVMAAVMENRRRKGQS